ncbi:hypothetical protein ABW20_dc0105348 [Dactylellina cionopaga]|nr:hypothetical protein ABW20_dc0105348 [Dactylellina cionopaga]
MKDYDCNKRWLKLRQMASDIDTPDSSEGLRWFRSREPVQLAGYKPKPERTLFSRVVSISDLGTISGKKTVGRRNSLDLDEKTVIPRNNRSVSYPSLPLQNEAVSNGESPVYERYGYETFCMHCMQPIAPDERHKYTYNLGYSSVCTCPCSSTGRGTNFNRPAIAGGTGCFRCGALTVKFTYIEVFDPVASQPEEKFYLAVATPSKANTTVECARGGQGGGDSQGTNAVTSNPAEDRDTRSTVYRFEEDYDILDGGGVRRESICAGAA